MINDPIKKLFEKGKNSVATGYAILGLTAYGFYEGMNLISKIGPPQGSGNIADGLFYPAAVLPLSILTVIGGSIGVSLARKYRTCHKCHEKGLKKEMLEICVPDGIMDYRYVWAHNNCAKKHLEKSKNARGPFGLMTSIAAKNAPKKTLEKLSEDN